MNRSHLVFGVPFWSMGDSYFRPFRRPRHDWAGSPARSRTRGWRGARTYRLALGAERIERDEHTYVIHVYMSIVLFFGVHHFENSDSSYFLTFVDRDGTGATRTSRSRSLANTYCTCECGSKSSCFREWLKSRLLFQNKLFTRDWPHYQCARPADANTCNSLAPGPCRSPAREMHWRVMICIMNMQSDRLKRLTRLVDSNCTSWNTLAKSAPMKHACNAR
jgi:hypothetical protein